MIKDEHKIIFFSTLAGLALWIIDAVIDSLVFAEGTFFESLMFDVPGHEIYSRSLFLLGFILFGVLISRTLTRRRQVEEELRKAVIRIGDEMAKTEAIIAAIGDGISIQDTNFRVLYQNQVHKDLEGGDKAGQYCYAAYAGKARVCEGCPLSASFGNGEIHTIERTAHTDNGIRDIEITASPLRDSTGKIIAGIEVVRDITGRKYMEDKMREERDSVQRYLDIAGVMLVVVDNNQKVSLINKRGCEILGYNENEIIGKNWFDNFIPEGLRDKVRVIFEKIMHGEIEPFEYFENSVLTRNGTERTISWHNTILKDEAGKITGALSSGDDVTVRKKLEEQLRHAQKMEAIGTLTGGISHEFNNILTAIMGCGEFLQEAIKTDDPLRTYVDMISASARRAANLTRGLLAYSRKQIIHQKSLALNEIIRKIEGLLSKFIGEDIELEIVPSDTDIIVMVDSNQIEQVIMNLAANARDAMPEGGRLTIKTGFVELDNRYTRAHGYGEPGMYALISIIDTGMGMDDRTRQKIFEPFFTTKEVGKGTGLGLSMVYGIIEKHNGFIEAQSEPGKGTTFNIYLPAVISDVEETEPSSPPPAAGGSETILVAEDDAEVRGLMKDLLEKSGYKVIEATDGEDAVEKARENRDRIRLLLCDMVMPRKNGKEAYDEIIGIIPDLKALFVSGYEDESIHKKGIPEGLNIISKPFLQREFLKGVRDVLDKGVL